MIVLGFDTSAAHCAAALLKDGKIVVERRQEMARGQSEYLMVLIEDLLQEQTLSWADLDAIGVGVGPGNFTGIRICVSAARGLALGLGIPAIGVNRFDIIAEATGDSGIPCVNAPQGKYYIQEPGKDPRLIDADEAKTLDASLVLEPEGLNPAISIARLAAQRSTLDNPRPAPLYIKAADAAPARDAPPKIIA